MQFFALVAHLTTRRKTFYALEYAREQAEANTTGRNCPSVTKVHATTTALPLGYETLRFPTEHL
jgi:hypothetical protein